MDHYTWLNKNFLTFLTNLGIDYSHNKAESLISKHGDKAYCYENFWKKEGN